MKVDVWVIKHTVSYGIWPWRRKNEREYYLYGQHWYEWETNKPVDTALNLKLTDMFLRLRKAVVDHPDKPNPKKR